MKRHGFVRPVGYMGQLVLLWALPAGCAGAVTGADAGVGTPYHHQMTALYVIDHRGHNPRSNAELATYSHAFLKILAGCSINADDLTNMTLDLADQASAVGRRNVSSLDMLQAIARRVVWTGLRGCGSVFANAEAHQEAGDP